MRARGVGGCSVESGDLHIDAEVGYRIAEEMAYMGLVCVEMGMAWCACVPSPESSIELQMEMRMQRQMNCYCRWR